MKTLTALIVMAAVGLLSSAHAQWNGGGCDRQVNVTVNRYNYYGAGHAACSPGYSGWNNCAPWGYNGYGQPIPNGLGWTLFGFQAAAALFAPRPQVVYVQYPMYQPPASVIIER
jgi:hypothetical protein